MVHIQQDGVGGTCEAQPTKGLGITAAHVHQRKQNGEWKGAFGRGGEQETKNSKGRKERRGGGRKPGNLLFQDMSANKYANKYKYSSIKIMMLRRK